MASLNYFRARKQKKQAEKRINILKPVIAERKKDVQVVQKYTQNRRMAMPEGTRLANVMAEPKERRNWKKLFRQ